MRKLRTWIILGVVLFLPLTMAAKGCGGSTAGAAGAVHWAKSQIGCPYVWGGTGPCSSGYDCSGLVMEAEAAVGIAIPRTSQDQWAKLSHDFGPARGELVFFAGLDGTVSAPGHVGLVLGPHRMIEAYAQGVPVRISTFGLSTSPQGDQIPIGYATP
jgi:cell wall-associated NlpC family hydrolase